MNSLTFDIETVPQQEKLSTIQQEELDKKLKRYLAKRPDEDPEEAKNLLQGTSPYFGEIVCIGLHRMKANGDSGSTCLVGDEEEILEDFWDNIRGFRGVFVGYNSKGFDRPFIVKRSMKHGIPPSNMDFLDTYRYSHKTHADCQDIISEFNNWNAPSLRLACEHFGIPSPKEGGIRAENVAQAYKDGRIDEIAEYCERDVIATFKLYQKLQVYIKS